MARESSAAELAFATRWRQLAPDVDLTPELEFHPTRRWRFDFADPTGLVAIEIEGGVYSGGRHTRGAGFEEDCVKYNAAAELGWLVFRFTPDMVERDPLGCIMPAAETIRARRLAFYAFHTPAKVAEDPSIVFDDGQGGGDE